MNRNDAELARVRELNRLNRARQRAAKRTPPPPVQIGLPDSSWLDDAACFKFGVDTEVFFPPTNGPGRYRKGAWDEPRSICSVCPVRTPCLDDALRWEAGRGVQRVGFVGGMTPEERAREHASRQS